MAARQKYYNFRVHIRFTCNKISATNPEQAQNKLIDYFLNKYRLRPKDEEIILLESYDIANQDQPREERN